MVQIIPREPSLAELLGSGMSQGLQTGLKTMMDRRQQQKSGSALSQILNMPEMQQQFSQLPVELQKSLSTELLKPRLRAADVQALEKAGFTPEEASLYAMASTGGQTEIMKSILENRKRKIGNQISEPSEQQIEDVLKNPDINLTPAEKVKRENDRYKTNLPEYKKLKDSEKLLKSESRKVDFLDSLNKTDKLPKGLGLLNVDRKGNLRLPMFASKEAQAYVKTINEFLQGAKDNFGARVTNFEVDLFLKRLPTLWNSKEGREYVIKQLKIVNQINQLSNQGTLQGIDKAGGLRKVDYDSAVSYGESVNQKEIEKLENEYRQIEDQIQGISGDNKRALGEIFK